jgi:hypothetical protein
MVLLQSLFPMWKPKITPNNLHNHSCLPRPTVLLILQRLLRSLHYRVAIGCRAVASLVLFFVLSM